MTDPDQPRFTATPVNDTPRTPTDPYRALPSVSDLARLIQDAAPGEADAVATSLAQAYLSRMRARIAAGDHLTRGEIEQGMLAELAAWRRPRLTPLLNATGVIIHTNLGRAPVSQEVAAAMAAAAANPVALEIEPETNQRGGRMREISDLMRALTGAEATLVVNNGAAAVLLAVSAIAAGQRVIVSRGEAVEIGGGFRIPDVVQQSGAELVEVGATNRTYARDYARATDERTAAYLKVHPSNFQIAGFVHQASTADLAQLGREHGVLVIEDLGSGALLDTAAFGLEAEPTIAGSIAAGAAVVTASGDKLLGGPQAGLICGEAATIARIAQHPLARAVRADKTCLAGLAATLRHYARGDAVTAIPVWRMIAATGDAIQVRAEAARRDLAQRGIDVTVVATRASVGGGSLPGQTLPSCALALDGPVEELAQRLRLGQPGVFGRIERGRLLLDLRTVLPEDDGLLVEVIGQLLG